MWSSYLPVTVRERAMACASDDVGSRHRTNGAGSTRTALAASAQAKKHDACAHHGNDSHQYDEAESYAVLPP